MNDVPLPGRAIQKEKRPSSVGRLLQPRSPVRAIAAAALVLAPRAASGCATCFGDPGSAAQQGMNFAILLLLGVVLLVYVGLVRLFLEFRRRARLLEQRERRFRLIHGGAR